MSRTFHRPEIFKDIVDEVASILKEYGHSIEDAQAAGETAAERLASLWGGAHIYVSKLLTTTLARRDHEMWKSFSGKNYHELAVRFGLSEMRVRQIIERQRASERGSHGRTGK